MIQGVGEEAMYIEGSGEGFGVGKGEETRGVCFALSMMLMRFQAWRALQEGWSFCYPIRRCSLAGRDFRSFRCCYVDGQIRCKSRKAGVENVEGEEKRLRRLKAEKNALGPNPKRQPPAIPRDPSHPRHPPTSTPPSIQPTGKPSTLGSVGKLQSQ